MKFLITNMDGFRNKGEEAYLKAIVDEIRQLDSSSHFKIFTWDPEYDAMWINRDHVSFLEAPFKSIPPPFRSLEFIERSSHYYRWAARLGVSEAIRKGIQAFQWADCVLVTGGDIFSSTYPGFFLRLASVKVATSSGKPVVLVAHSIGPFEKPKEYKAFKKAMSHVQLITARESLSLRYLEEMKLKDVRIELTADPAFCLKPDVEKTEKMWRLYGIPEGKAIVGVAPSQAIPHYSGISYDNHLDTIQNLIKFLTEKMDYHVILIPHVNYSAVKEDDRVICESLYRRLDFPRNITILSLTHTAEELRGIIGKFDLMIAERMHAAIAGLSQNVPTLVVGYSIKGGGILGDIFGFDSLQNYIVSIRETTSETLIERVRSLLDNRAETAAHLSKAIPLIREKARRNFSLIMETLRQKK